VNAWKPIFAALVIFAAGVVTGGLTVNLRQPRASRASNPPVKRQPPLPRDAQLRDLSHRMQIELDLAPEQVARVEAIVRESQERMKALRDEINSRIGEEFKEMRQKIRVELVPEQRKKFTEMMKQHDERNKRDDRTARPSPPAGKPE
jgi:Spy/CpxP family protein refolding chaperone